MRKKTYKLIKLEQHRFSILTDDLKTCYICGDYASDIHEIYGGANRKQSMLNGFCAPLCRNCHIFLTFDSDSNKFLKAHCQTIFEKNNTREDFIKIIGKSYLE